MGENQTGGERERRHKRSFDGRREERKRPVWVIVSRGRKKIQMVGKLEKYSISSII